MAQGEKHLILGTAGHIDHGKSSLVRALTGVDPDRLAEEKRRGITIELGFAQIELPDGTSMGVVDVPGHERFVRQMIAGATGIDVALLCVAADDGIMPQTREHMAVLRLLGVRSCVVALTKADLVDEEWAEFVADEVRVALADTPYAQAPIVAVSSRTSQGIDELKQAIACAARTASHIRRGDGFRMPVDRVFSIKGAGTVVTGTLWAGRVAADDEVEVLPGFKRARVRSVQVHSRAVDSACAGNRVALNLGGVGTDEVRPGDFLAAPDALRPTDRFDAWLTYVDVEARPDAKPLATGTRVHVAHGTREVVGRVLLMDGRAALAPGQSAYAQIRLDAELALSWRDRFVVRSYSPVRVIGGGVVLAAHPRRRTNLAPGEEALLDALCAEDAQAAVQAAALMRQRPFLAREVADACGCSLDTARGELEAMVASKRLASLGEGASAVYAQRPAFARALSALENALLKFHAENPLAPGVAKAELAHRMGASGSSDVIDALVAEAVRGGRAIAASGLISHPKAGAGAAAAEAQAAEIIAEELRRGGSAPEALSDIMARRGIDASVGRRAALALEKKGAVVRVDKELVYDADAFAALERAVVAHIGEHGPSTAADLKDAMGLTRKYAVPVLEHLDAAGVTVREGDVRRLK